MNYIAKLTLRAITKIAGPDGMKKLILEAANYAGLDMLEIAYNNIGILKYKNNIVSGEHFLISRILKQNLSRISCPIIFDVGANIGEYSMLLANEFPLSIIYAFEPNTSTFAQLVEKSSSPIKCINAGLGAEEKAEKIFTYSDNLSTAHASVYKDVFQVFHKRDDITEVDFQLTTLDLFCKQEGISNIDFLKIDTEGNELNVLKGAKRMLLSGKIKIIQFEFGECDIFSRVFLRDIYAILTNYNIYRLDSTRLIPLFNYSSTNEIFRFQNLVAVSKDFIFQDEL